MMIHTGKPPRLVQLEGFVSQLADLKIWQFPPPTLVDLLNDGDLVHVEEDPGGVAEQERGHDCHQDEGEIVLLLSPAAPSSLVDDEVNFVI